MSTGTNSPLSMFVEWTSPTFKGIRRSWLGDMNFIFSIGTQSVMYGSWAGSSCAAFPLGSSIVNTPMGFMAGWLVGCSWDLSCQLLASQEPKLQGGASGPRIALIEPMKFQLQLLYLMAPIASLWFYPTVAEASDSYKSEALSGQPLGLKPRTPPMQALKGKRLFGMTGHTSLSMNGSYLFVSGDLRSKASVPDARAWKNSWKIHTGLPIITAYWFDSILMATAPCWFLEKRGKNMEHHVNWTVFLRLF